MSDTILTPAQLGTKEVKATSEELMANDLYTFNILPICKKNENGDMVAQTLFTEGGAHPQAYFSISTKEYRTPEGKQKCTEALKKLFKIYEERLEEIQVQLDAGIDPTI